jgi:transcriptional regulator with XRE-family HTH domain
MGLITVARMGIAENLVRLRTAANLSQTALAKKAKVSQQLISQLERGENTTTKNLPAIAGALGVPVSSIDPSYHTPAVQARMVRVEGFVQAGEWEETWTWPEDDQYEVPVPMDPELIGYRLHAAETRGPSMNRRYPEKTVVIFTDAIETGEDVVRDRAGARGRAEGGDRKTALDRRKRPFLAFARVERPPFSGADCYRCQ